VIALLTSDTSELPVQVPIGVLRRSKQDHPRTTRKTWRLRCILSRFMSTWTKCLNQKERLSPLRRPVEIAAG
jgi:hypothetical protein